MTNKEDEKKLENKNNLLKYVSNPRTFTLKKWMFEILGGKYTKHDSVLERISFSLTTEQDLKDFGSLVTEIYEVAYRKAVEDYKQQAEKMGFKINVIAGEPS